MFQVSFKINLLINKDILSITSCLSHGLTSHQYIVMNLRFGFFLSWSLGEELAIVVGVSTNFVVFASSHFDVVVSTLLED